MSVADWRILWRDAVTDPECSAWLRGILGSYLDGKNARWIGLAVRRATDRASGDYRVRLPSLIGRQLDDHFRARVGDRLYGLYGLYGLCGLCVGDAKVYFAGGSSPACATMAQVHEVLTDAFAVHG